MPKEYAFFSVHDNDKVSSLAGFAADVAATGLTILSSGGTARFLRKEGVQVITVREMVIESMSRRLVNVPNPAPYSPLTSTQCAGIAELLAGPEQMLGHRVVTLRPEVHGALLATDAMLDELESYGMGRIVLVRTGFYPLAEEIVREGHTIESVFEKTDIGGPTMIMAAVKGDRLPLIESMDYLETLAYLNGGRQDGEFRLRMQLRAVQGVVKYYNRLAGFLQAQSYR